MRSVATAIQGFDYDPEQGTFRAWLYTVSRNKISSFFRHERRRPQAAGSSELLAAAEAQLARAESEERTWELDYRRQLFQWASGRAAR